MEVSESRYEKGVKGLERGERDRGRQDERKEGRLGIWSQRRGGMHYIICIEKRRCKVRKT